MTIVLIFLAGIMATIIWWLARQTIGMRPWEASPAAVPRGAAASTMDTDGEPGSLRMPVRKVGLGLYLCVATSLFGLVMSAYFMRMGMADWARLSPPGLMWLNTGVLLASCLVVHRTRAAMREGSMWRAKRGLLVGGALTLLFVLGQLLVWQRLAASGGTPAANPANAFFYLVTAAHGAHLLGGLWVWGRATAGAWLGLGEPKLAMRIELCKVYWDYLFVVWLMLFAVLLRG